MHGMGHQAKDQLGKKSRKMGQIIKCFWHLATLLLEIKRKSIKGCMKRRERASGHGRGTKGESRVVLGQVNTYINLFGAILMLLGFGISPSWDCAKWYNMQRNLKYSIWHASNGNIWQPWLDEQEVEDGGEGGGGITLQTSIHTWSSSSKCCVQFCNMDDGIKFDRLCMIARSRAPDRNNRKEPSTIFFHFLSYLLLPRRQFNAAIK
jgi:hypothetical protein